MRNTQQGFTLIELVVVIVILGILAATAMPRFVNLSGDAELAKANAVAGAIASSASVNFAANLANAVANPYVRADACNGVYLQGGMTTGCSGALVGAVCTVTCDAVAATDTITLP